MSYLIKETIDQAEMFVGVCGKDSSCGILSHHDQSVLSELPQSICEITNRKIMLHHTPTQAVLALQAIYHDVYG